MSDKEHTLEMRGGLLGGMIPLLVLFAGLMAVSAAAIVVLVCLKAKKK